MRSLILPKSKNFYKANSRRRREASTRPLSLGFVAVMINKDDGASVVYRLIYNITGLVLNKLTMKIQPQVKC